MKCVHCQTEIHWNDKDLRWEDRTSPLFTQYCWVDPQLGSELHEPPKEAAVALTETQLLVGALRTIASYPTKSTDAAVLAMQRIASEALARV